MKTAFLGASKIGSTVAATLAQMPEIELYAVAARDIGRAEAYAREFGFKKACGSYEEMLSDPQVELVYLSTTISHHAEHMELCINSGKPVLCEKAFTSTAGEARRVLELAAEKNVLVAEAIWTRYMPMCRTIQEVVKSGRLGEIKTVHANLGYPVGHKPRLRDPKLSGGALLDIGIYPLTFASICLGDEIESLKSSAVMSDTGVDEASMTELAYEDGKRAFLYSTSMTPTDRTGSICGDRGYAVVENNNNFQEIRIYDAKNNLAEVIKAPPQISGYEYQFYAVMEALRRGEIQCPEMPHDRIIHMMSLMDSIRHCWGMYYPCEEQE